MGRRLGQHFLVRPSLLERIAELACPEPQKAVVEIGPGRGALTTHLLSRTERLIAIEIDPVLVHYLRAEFKSEPRLEILEGDILKTGLPQVGPMVVAGNLPYYITSPIIEQVLHARERVVRAVFLVQKEVAERITTGPGSRDYGYLSVLVQFFAEAEMQFTIPPGAFRPPPKVDSAVVRLIPRKELAVDDATGFLKFARLCFHQKRKTLRNNLSGAYTKEALDSLPESAKRAEQLSVNALVDLWLQLGNAGR